ncbi:MAG: OsmC family protein [Pseudomonadota bacterium]|jgi:organic hydroperoxide reductase OsmC/OhrA
MAEDQRFSVVLEQLQDYRFQVSFDWQGVPPLTLDIDAPVGGRAGPDAERLLAAAAANCLSASLLFALRKFKQNPGPLRAEASGSLVRNERGRLRIGDLQVTIHLAETAERLQHLERAAAQFEDFCTVTESIRRGIPVSVEVRDAQGALVHAAPAVEER